MKLETLTYEQYFGLSLNIDRPLGRMTHAVFRALNAASAQRLTAEFFAPVCDSAKEAEDRAFDWNAQLEFARAVASGMSR